MFVTSYSVQIMLNTCMPSRLVSLINYQHNIALK